MFLKNLEVIEDFHPLVKGLKIEFKKSICFLVGDNGIGKSTVLDCLASHYKFEDDTYMKRSGASNHITVEEESDFKVEYIDFHGHDKKFSGSFGNDLGLQLTQMKASSGQVTISLINKLGTFSDGLIILDEPERGLSIRNQWKIATAIYNLSKHRNCQIILTSHSDILLKTCEDTAQYFSISNNEDITYYDFMLEQLSPL